MTNECSESLQSKMDSKLTSVRCCSPSSILRVVTTVLGAVIKNVNEGEAAARNRSQEQSGKLTNERRDSFAPASQIQGAIRGDFSRENGWSPQHQMPRRHTTSSNG